MFETIDMITTNALAAMVYGVPIWAMLAFVHFVATHPAPQQIESKPPTSVSKPEQPSEPIPTVVEPRLTVSEPKVTVATPSIIECAPIDWTLWKVADLRDKATRGAFGIQSRQGGRMLKRKALIDQYERAIALR